MNIVKITTFNIGYITNLKYSLTENGIKHLMIDNTTIKYTLLTTTIAMKIDTGEKPMYKTIYEIGNTIKNMRLPTPIYLFNFPTDKATDQTGLFRTLIKEYINTQIVKSLVY